MAWQAKGLAAKFGNLSLIPGIRVMEEQKQLQPSCPATTTNTTVHVHPHSQINVLNETTTKKNLNCSM